MKDNTKIGYIVRKADDENLTKSNVVVELSTDLNCYLRGLSPKYKNVNKVLIVLNVEVESVNDEVEDGEVEEGEK